MLRWTIVLGVVILIGVGIYFLSSEKTPVDVAVAGKGEIRAFVDERAKTRLPHIYRITMPQGGRILAIDLDEGSYVKAGEVVARMDPADLATMVAESKSQVEALTAQINLTNDLSLEKSSLDGLMHVLASVAALVKQSRIQTETSMAKKKFFKSKLDRIEKLVKKQATSEQEHEKAQLDAVSSKVEYETDVLNLRISQLLEAAAKIWPQQIREWINLKQLQIKVHQAEKKEAEARLDKAKRDQQRGTIHSPVSGTVLNRRVSNERVLSPGEILLEIGDLAQLEIEADILSQDVVAIREKQPAEIYGPAIGEKPIRGHVKKIFPAGFTKISSLGVEQQRVKVLVSFDPEELNKLSKQGRQLGVDYRIRVRIFTAKKSGVVKIPRNAIFRNGSGIWQAFVVRNGRATLTDVEVGIMNDEEVEIVSGIEAKEQVILAPETNLVDGTRVDPRMLN